MPREHSLNWINRPIHRNEIDAKFIKKHERSLANVARSIKNLESQYEKSNKERENPELTEEFYVMSLTRTGPRIIELMEIGDIEYDDVEIISEKSLDFMPTKSFRGANVALFDDIAVTGRTIKIIKLYLEKEYEMNVFPHLLAVDDERLSINRDDLNYYLELNPGKRFQFIHEMVNAFTFLNKPYDVDHAIFYSEIGSGQRNEFEELDDCYDLTTPYQAEHGFRRYAIIPGKLDRTFLDSNVFTQGLGDTQIEKLRIYYDERTGAVRYVPVSIFSLYKRAARSQALFSPTYDRFNKILSMGHEHLDTDRPSLAMFRLVWYLRSFITGKQYFQEYLSDIDTEIQGAPLGESLNHRDLSILFGPELGWKIRSALYDSQITASNSSPSKFGSQKKSTHQNYTNPGPVQFDEKQEAVVEEISSYISANLNTCSSLSEQVATVFEAFHVEVERDAIERYGSQTGGGSRRERDLGLSYPQIRKLLEDNGVELDTKDAEIGLSLSFDFLIDSGVQVPIFYERGSVLERTYRHGEGVLNNTRYAYLVDAVAEEVFDEIEAIDGSRSFSKVAFEKIGFLIGDKLDNSEYWAQTSTELLSLLREPLLDDTVSERVRVSPGVHRHGRIQVVDRIGEMGSKRLFNQWAQEEGIIQENEQSGIRKSGSWKKNSRIDREIVPDEMLNDFEAIGICCSHINKKLENEHLVAITTCRTEGEFVNAARKEIELVFENSKYSLPESINKLSTLTDEYSHILESPIADLDPESLLDTLDDVLQQSKSSKSAISDILNKHNYWENLDDYISDIESLFVDSDRHLQIIFRSGLKSYLENLSQDRSRATERSDHIRKKTIYTGRLIKGLSQVLIDLALVAKAILSQRNIRPTLASFYDSITEWNQLIRESAPGRGNQEFSRLSQLDLSASIVPQISEEVNDPKRYQDKVTALQIVDDLLPKIKYQMNVVEKVYEHTFKVDSWEERYSTFYPDEKSSSNEVVETSWVMWYDMKASTAPDNEDSAQRLKSHLNSLFKDIREDEGDVFFEEGMADSKHIFTNSEEAMLRFLRVLLRSSDDAGIVERIGICKTRPNEVVRNVEDDTYDSELAHRLSKRLGEFVQRSDEYTESETEHTLTISEDVLVDIFGSNPVHHLADWRLEKQGQEMSSLKGVPRRIMIHSIKINSEVDESG